jgi:ParB/Sulfiredoxin domain
MTTLRLNKITLEKKAQPRLALSADMINQYCEAIIDGAKFPPVTIFKDGNKNYLADGYHRYEANKKAGNTHIECEVKRGALRDAIFFSLSANAEHGLNRTASDKRRLVSICLDDKTWSKKSGREIARICAVSNTFVSQMIANEKDKKERDKAAKNSVNVDTSPQKTVKKQQPKKTKAVGFDEHPDKISVAPEGKVIVDKDHYEEMMDNYESTLTENENYEKIIGSDDPLKASYKRIKKLESDLSIVTSRVKGLMNEKNEAVRMVKARNAVIKQQKQKMKAAGLKDF